MKTKLKFTTDNRAEVLLRALATARYRAQRYGQNVQIWLSREGDAFELYFSSDDPGSFYHDAHDRLIFTAPRGFEPGVPFGTGIDDFFDDAREDLSQIEG